MSLVNFYKGPESEYLEETHGGGIYQCTDSENTYIFGVKNKSSETEIINLAFTALPDNGSQHTIDQSTFNKLVNALDSNKVIYVRTACNLFLVHSIYDVSIYTGAERSTVHLYFHFNMGDIGGSTAPTQEEIIRDINGYITIDISQTPDENNEYIYTIYTTSPYYVLDKITDTVDINDFSNDYFAELSNTLTAEDFETIKNLTNNTNIGLILKVNAINVDSTNLVFTKCSDLYISISEENSTLENISFSSNYYINTTNVASSGILNLCFTKISTTTIKVILSVNGIYSHIENNYLSKDNTKSYTPSEDYNPATKKYVDDKLFFIDCSIGFRIVDDKIVFTDTIMKNFNDLYKILENGELNNYKYVITDINTIISDSNFSFRQYNVIGITYGSNLANITYVIISFFLHSGSNIYLVTLNYSRSSSSDNFTENYNSIKLL